MTTYAETTPLNSMVKELIQNVKYYSHDFWEIHGDNRVSRLPLLSKLKIKNS